VTGLSLSDKRFVDEYIRKHSRKRVMGLSPSVAGAILSIAGLILTVAVINAIDKYIFSEYAVVLLLCLLPGLLLLLGGVHFLELDRRYAKERRLCKILRGIRQERFPPRSADTDPAA